MNKIPWFLVLLILLGFMAPFDASRATGPYADSLYIVKPEADSLHWGSKVIGAAPVARTIRLLGHCPDSLIGIVYSSNACFTLNGTVKDTLQYIIPDTNGVFEFTVSFVPTYRGDIEAWVYYSDPFDSTALYGSATGGTSPKPMGPSIFDHSPFSGSGEGVNAYGQKQPGYVNGIFPPMVYSGEGVMLEVSAGCLRASFDSIVVDADTTTGVFTSYTDSLTTQSIAWNVAGSNYAHATMASGLPENAAIPVRVRACRTNDASCCLDTTITIITECGALSSPIDFEVILAPDSAGMEEPSDSGFIAYWDTRTPTSGNLRYYDTGIDTGWVYADIFTTEAYAHGFWVPIVLEPSTTYYVSVDNWNACSDHLGWSDSLEFTTGADTLIGTCPAVMKSGIATKTITASSANLTLNSSLDCIMRFRYHTSPAGEWIYRTESSDSAGHTINVAGLTGSTGYVWETKPIHSQCSDTTAVAYGDSTAFTTLTSCPTVTQSDFAVQEIGTTTATFHFHTDYATHGGYRYGLYAAANTYRHDADADSVEHTISVTGLTANHTRYKVLFNNKYSGCDSSGAHTDQLDWYTACAAITASWVGVCSSNDGAGPYNVFTVMASRASQAYMHYRKGTGAYSANVDLETYATHVAAVDKANFNAGEWNWEWWYVDECGNTSAMQAGTTFTCSVGGLCVDPCPAE